MDINGQLKFARGFLGELHRLHAPARIAARLGMRLDAAHEVGVVARRLDDRLHIDAGGAVKLDIAMAEEAAGEISGNEGKNARLRFLDDELAEPVKGQRTRAALIDDGGDAGADADEIRVEAEIARDMLVDMGMRVDEAGRDDEALGVDDFGAAGVECWRDCRDAALADGDIANGVDPVLRVDDSAASDDSVE